CEPRGQETTGPNGAAPGIKTGEPGSSVSDVPFTAKALTAAAPASTTYRLSPSGETCASKGRRPLGFENGVEPTRVSWPFPASAEREIDGTAVLTANSARPSGLIATQQGAVWLSANGDPEIAVRPPL